MVNDLKKRLSSAESQIIHSLESRHLEYGTIMDDIIEAYLILRDSYESDRKVLIVGNGGSAADAEHMVGELMKQFLISRPISQELKETLASVSSEKGLVIAEALERPLPAISLVSNISLSTAYINDVCAENVYAQQVLGLAKKGDVLVAISTSGNSENIIRAAIVAKALECRVIALTGKDGGELKNYSDVAVIAPGMETYLIQEVHLSIYHCWCMMLEKYFFSDL